MPFQRDRHVRLWPGVAGLWLAIASIGAVALVSSPAISIADGGSSLPFVGVSPRPHVAGDVYDYLLHGTLSQAIVGRDPFGRSVKQAATPTDLLGRERIAIKSVAASGLSLHRSGSIVATFKGRSSPSQRGTGWTLVTPEGDVRDRKGSTLGGLFLLPLAFLADRAVDGGLTPAIGSTWTAKLGMALFGMTAQPRLRFQITGSRKVLGVLVYTLTATGTAPVKEPVVTNDGIALGDAVGTSHVTLRCDYDPAARRAVSMDIAVASQLAISSQGKSTGTLTERQHYLVALDAGSIGATSSKANDPPAATSPPRL
ncbi:MAG TPA: hypothetical protein VFO25_09480 [Candidatus Eremiobacteraceae bacterium]|nr:hypothetical protein [Candidatus Eremiobacteraceae bacterium]